MSNTDTEHRGVEQTEARLANLQEVAGSTPAPATTLKCGPGRPRKDGSVPREQAALALAEIEPQAIVERGYFSCTISARRFQRDTVTAIFQLVPDGPLFKVQMIAAEDLDPATELEIVPGLPMMLRKRR